jgi:hypothetical protein
MKHLYLIFSATLVFYSCYTNTKITGSWKNGEEVNNDHKNYFVAVLSGNNLAKSTLENEMETALRKAGARVEKSMQEFPPRFAGDSVSKQQMIDKVKERGCDAILTVSILKKETQSRYISGGYLPIDRFGYYRNFWGYYNYRYPYAYDPGYYVEDEIYYLETNIYDVHKDILIWSAQSRTYNFGDLKSFAKEFSEIMVNKMAADGILKNSEDKTRLAKETN